MMEHEDANYTDVERAEWGRQREDSVLSSPWSSNGF